MIPGILRKTSALLAGFALLAAPALSQNTTPAPAETRRLHVELTLEEAIRAAQEQSIAAMVAKYTFLSSYWSFRSFRASRLPSLNLSGEVLSFDRSLRLLQDYDTGEMRYLENYNLQNTIGLSIRQNIALTGGTLQLVAQPAGPVRPQRFEILLLAAHYALLHPAALRLQPVQVGQEDRTQGVRAGQTHLHRGDGGRDDAGRELLLRPAAEQDPA